MDVEKASAQGGAPVNSRDVRESVGGGDFAYPLVDKCHFDGGFLPVLLGGFAVLTGPSRTAWTGLRSVDDGGGGQSGRSVESEAAREAFDGEECVED